MSSRRVLRSERADSATILTLPDDLGISGKLLTPSEAEKRIKREYETGMFVTVRNRRGSEAVDIAELHAEVNQYLHARENDSGLRGPPLARGACCEDANAQDLLEGALHESCDNQGGGDWIS